MLPSANQHVAVTAQPSPTPPNASVFVLFLSLFNFISFYFYYYFCFHRVFTGSGSHDTTLGSPWKNGDMINISVSGFDQEYVCTGDKLKIKFTINGKEVGFHSLAAMIFIFFFLFINFIQTEHINILSIWRKKDCEQ
jgi:hypothetical protein